MRLHYTDHLSLNFGTTTSDATPLCGGMLEAYMTRSHDTLIHRVCDCLRRPELLVLYHYTDVIGGFWESLLALLKPR